eukprot:m.282299 g.282299  ORF g.282299 m.282299 type:complete len:392 (+) comp19845_c2_seq2:49-1224(+)
MNITVYSLTQNGTQHRRVCVRGTMMPYAREMSRCSVARSRWSSVSISSVSMSSTLSAPPPSSNATASASPASSITCSAARIDAGRPPLLVCVRGPRVCTSTSGSLSFGSTEASRGGRGGRAGFGGFALLQSDSGASVMLLRVLPPFVLTESLSFLLTAPASLSACCLANNDWTHWGCGGVGSVAVFPRSGCMPVGDTAIDIRRGVRSLLEYLSAPSNAISIAVMLSVLPFLKHSSMSDSHIDPSVTDRANFDLINSQTEALDMASKIPSHPRKINSSDGPRGSTTTSGMAVSICSSGNSFASSLKVWSPSARATARQRHIRPDTTQPPAFSIRAFSSLSSGFWSFVLKKLAPSRHTMARLSPTLEMTRCLGVTKTVTAVVPGSPNSSAFVT